MIGLRRLKSEGVSRCSSLKVTGLTRLKNLACVMLAARYHFGLTTDAEPKHISSRFFLRGGLGLLYRLLSLGVDHIYLWRKRISVDLHFFLFLVGKTKPTLLDFFLDLLL